MNLDKKYFNDYENIVGCDEVGRGPIAGPVVACAVKLSKASNDLIKELQRLNITDSKKLSEKKRNNILLNLNIDVHKLELNKVYKTLVNNQYFEFCLYEHDHLEIDEMNILQASLSAMKKAGENLSDEKSILLIDGNKTFETKFPCESVVKGDSKVLAIGMASIIAKNFRDEKMKVFDEKYPGYGLAKHAGYPTKFHKDAVEKLGPTPIHRKTFKGVKEHL